MYWLMKFGFRHQFFFLLAIMFKRIFKLAIVLRIAIQTPTGVYMYNIPPTGIHMPDIYKECDQLVYLKIMFWMAQQTHDNERWCQIVVIP